MEKFGERIRELRKERGLTSRELAGKLGISRNTLTSWERGAKEPRGVEILEEMASILNVSLKNLLLSEKESENEEGLEIKKLSERVSRLEEALKRMGHDDTQAETRTNIVFGGRSIEKIRQQR